MMVSGALHRRQLEDEPSGRGQREGPRQVGVGGDHPVEVEVAVIPPHPFLVPVKDQVDGVDGNKVAVGSQDLYTEDAGAFTGASSTGMLASVGCEYILCGHSERRSVFGDSDEMVNKKVHKVLDQGLKAILCIGESKEEYEAGLNKEICAVHIGKGLTGVTAEQMESIVIAYEPTVDELMACPDIDGALVGGASLVAEKFARIVGFKAPVSA
ncbi:unnamed protein product [Ectocarpus sp. 6 AP-2014]